jgi:D-amino-acid dehydrogenase
MHIAVIGGGVIGTTTAWYLACHGHQVSVLDRQPRAGLETSFANAGQISPGYATPWAAPGIPIKAIRWMLSEHSPLVIRARHLDPSMVRFLAMMLVNCRAARYERNKERMLRIAEYSRRAFADLREETGISYDQGHSGTLQIFRSQKQLDSCGKDTEVLKRFGVPYEILDVNGCIAVEPGLAASRDKIVGGLRLPLDETGDCFKFTTRLATLCSDKGVDFRFGVKAEALDVESDQVTGVHTDKGRIEADAYVMALGSYSTRLLRPIGIDIPVYPVKGYSITLPVIDGDRAPRSTLMDETYKVAITRLADRVRVAGTAELAGFDMGLDQGRRKTIRHVAADLFGEAVDMSDDQFWTGLRPMTPDSTPVVGTTPYRNLFLNTGHGTLGWTMSCGSSRLVANLVSGRDPEVDRQGLEMSRYRFADRVRPSSACRNRNLAPAHS